MINQYPDYIDGESWGGFLAMRKLIKSPMTDRAKKMALKKLAKFHAQGMDVNAILEQSEFNNWKDLYPVKGEDNGKSGRYSSFNTVSRSQQADDALTSYLGGDKESDSNSVAHLSLVETGTRSGR